MPILYIKKGSFSDTYPSYGTGYTSDKTKNNDGRENAPVEMPISWRLIAGSESFSCATSDPQNANNMLIRKIFLLIVLILLFVTHTTYRSDIMIFCIKL